MIPVGAIAAAAAAAAARAGKKQGGTGKQQPPSFRGASDGQLGTWAVFVWFVLGPIGLGLGLSLLAGQVFAILPLVPIVLLTFPWPIAQLVLIPLGQARLAYWITYASDFFFHLDRRGGAAIAAAWALARQPKLDEPTADWLVARLAGEQPLRGAGVAATALLLSARGDQEGARALFATVPEIDDCVCPPEAKRIASAWLASDAAERGEWQRVAELGMTVWQGGRLGWLLAGIAQSLLLEPSAPSKHGLWLRWALAPHRDATRPLVERAVQALDGAFIDPEDEPPIAPAQPPEGADAIRTALSLHASVLARSHDAVRPEDVRAVGQAWDAALEDRATERLLYERALVLGGGVPAATLAKVRSAIEDDLAAVVLASGISLKDSR
ncbi:MAG: hypothetical protein QM820_52705 [Minicystis sp.]